MELLTRETGNMEGQRGTAHLSTPLVTLIKGSGLEIKHLDMENI